MIRPDGLSSTIPPLRIWKKLGSRLFDLYTRPKLRADTRTLSIIPNALVPARLAAEVAAWLAFATTAQGLKKNRFTYVSVSDVSDTR